MKGDCSTWAYIPCVRHIHEPFVCPSQHHSHRPKSQRYTVLLDFSHRWGTGLAFSLRLVRQWNKLPASVVTGSSVNMLKKCIEDFLTKYSSPQLPTPPTRLHTAYKPDHFSYFAISWLVHTWLKFLR